MICYFRTSRLRDEKEAESQERTLLADKGTKWLQSWTESVENFALSYPQNAHPADLVPLWPLPSPQPGQSCLVGIRNDEPDLKIVSFSGGRGSICSCKCFQQLYIETGHGNVHFSQYFSSPFLPSCARKCFRSSLIASFKKTKWLAAKPTKIEKLTKVFLLNYVRCMAREDRRHKAIALTT